MISATKSVRSIMDAASTAGPEPVLAGVDGGPGTAAVVRAAARLARVAGTELLIAHILDRPAAFTPEGAALCAAITEEDVLAGLVPDLCEALLDETVSWTVVCRAGVPSTALVRLACDVRPMAIVVGADTSGWWARLRRGLTGSVPQRLLRRQDAPVIVIPTACSHPRRRHEVGRAAG
ncbi:MAG: universal stress protein [Jatrophihabitans sp.]|uniref:universal stress protein n=1 Tax=Jatrophihabitans sp. TaxID=1932789 RepID=UPI003F80E9D5